jgi:hypothetical protein
MLHKDAFWRIYVATNNKNYSSLHENFLIYLSDFDQMWNFIKFFLKDSNVKFHGYPSSDSRAYTSRLIDGHDEGNMHYPKCYVQRTAYINKDIPVK